MNPRMYPDTITVYNHFFYLFGAVPKTRYDRTVLRGVVWKRSNDRNQDSAGKSVPDMTVSIVIPVNVKASDGKTYINPQDFEYLPQDNVSHWTLDYRAAASPDVIVFGECLDEVAGLITIADIKERHTACTIKAVSDYTNTKCLPHWEVMGI